MRPTFGRRAGIMALLTLATCLAGCNWFRPEKAPLPSDPPPPSDYTQPEQTLETLKLAIEDKRSLSAGNYIGAFADSTLEQVPGFHQFFYPAEADQWRQSGKNVPEDWDVRLERRFFDVGQSSLINLNPNTYYEVTFTRDDDSPPDLVGVSPTILHRKYQIVAFDESSNQAVEIIARGIAHLTFYETPGKLWRITRWDDEPDLSSNVFGLPQVSWGQRRLESQ